MDHRRMSQLFLSLSLSLGLYPSLAFPQYVPHHTFLVNNDGSSAECLSCHDGSFLHPVPFCTGNCSYGDPHIIDTPYPPMEKLDSYRPPQEAEAAGIRFPYGLVTCISCHNLLNPARFHLAVSNERSRLCLSCHNQ